MLNTRLSYGQMYPAEKLVVCVVCAFSTALQRVAVCEARASSARHTTQCTDAGTRSRDQQSRLYSVCTPPFSPPPPPPSTEARTERSQCRAPQHNCPLRLRSSRAPRAFASDTHSVDGQTDVLGMFPHSAHAYMHDGAEKITAYPHI